MMPPATSTRHGKDCFVPSTKPNNRPPEQTHSPTRSGSSLDWKGLVERTARDKSPQERKTFRSARATPILDKIKTWLDEKLTQVLPKSPLGTAITYTLKLWPKLVTCLEDGHIEIDNNRAENAIRPFVIGRKGWLFSGSPRGAHASATLYTLVE